MRCDMALVVISRDMTLSIRALILMRCDMAFTVFLPHHKCSITFLTLFWGNTMQCVFLSACQSCNFAGAACSSLLSVILSTTCWCLHRSIKVSLVAWGFNTTPNHHSQWNGLSQRSTETPKYQPTRSTRPNIRCMEIAKTWVNSAAADVLASLTPGHLQIQLWPQTSSKYYPLFTISHLDPVVNNTYFGTSYIWDM